MPMIDVYAPEGVFADKHTLARRLAAAVMAVEQVPEIAMFRQNTAAFIHELSADAISNVDGGSDYVRVQVLTNAGGLDRDKQIVLVARLTELIAGAAGNPPCARADLGAAHGGHRRRLGALGARAYQCRAGGSGTA